MRHDASGPPQRVDAYIAVCRATWRQTNPQNGSYSALVRARRGTSPEAVAAAVDAVGRRLDARDFNGRGLKLYPVGLEGRPRLARPAGARSCSARPACVLASHADGQPRVGAARPRGAARARVRGVARARRQHVADRARDAARRRPARRLPAARSARSPPSGRRARSSRSRRSICRAAKRSRSTGALPPSSSPSASLLGLARGGGAGGVGGAHVAVVAARGSAVRGGGGHGRMRRGMIVAQVALSLVLLSSRRLVVRSFERLLRADPGFRPDGVFTMRVRTPPEFFPQMDDAIAFQDRVEQALAAIPGVTGVSATSALPLTASAGLAAIGIPGAPGNTGDAERTRCSSTSSAARRATSRSWACGSLPAAPSTECAGPGVREAHRSISGAHPALLSGRQPARRDHRRQRVAGAADDRRRRRAGAALRRSPGRPAAALRSRRGLGLPAAVVRRAQPAAAGVARCRRFVRRCARSMPASPVGELRTLEEIVDGTLRQQQTGAAADRGVRDWARCCWRRWACSASCPGR